MKMDMNSMPVANIIISSENMDRDELKFFAEDTIQSRIERQPGVASVDIVGGSEKEIRIEIAPERLEGLGLDMSSIAQILMAENTNMSGGIIEYGEKSLTISSKLKMESIDDVKKTPIKLSSGAVVQLQDIAEITESEKEMESISRYNGQQCINLKVTKASDGNTVTTVNAVKKEVEKISKEYNDIICKVVNESGSIIENSINNVVSNIFVGAAFAILVLFIFLKNIGLTGIVAVSMPLSIIINHWHFCFTLFFWHNTELSFLRGTFHRCRYACR